MKQVHSQGSIDRVFRTESTTKVIARRDGIALVAVVLIQGSADPSLKKNEVTLTSQVNSKSGSPTGPSVRKSQNLENYV